MIIGLIFHEFPRLVYHWASRPALRQINPVPAHLLSRGGAITMAAFRFNSFIC
jgi:hypothetical protein